MAQDDRIKRIKETANLSSDSNVLIRLIDSLAAYKKKSISAITDIINSPVVDGQVRAYGAATIARIKRTH